MSKGRYYRIQPSFWQDPKVRNQWTEDMRMLALYLTTSPHRNMVGLFYCPLSYMEDDLQWKSGRIRAAFEALCSAAVDFCRYDTGAQVVLLVDALKNDAPATERQVQGALRIIGNLPATFLITDLADVSAMSCPTLANGIRMQLESQSSDTRTPYPVLRTPYTDNRIPYTAKPDTALETQSTADAVDVSASSISLDEIAEIWNRTCGEMLPKTQKLTAERRRHLKARLREAGRDAAWWQSYFGRIAASQFCLGGKDGTGWRASFDWAIRSEDVIAKVLEGQYDNRAPLAAPPVVKKPAPPVDTKPMSEYLRELGVTIDIPEIPM